MPTDRNRINGPESTIPYQLYTKLNRKSNKQSFLELFKSKGNRKDDRKLLEHRKIFIKTGVVSAAKGSAYIEMNQTKVIVSAFDPREIPNKTDYSLNGEIYCDFKYAPFSCRKRRLYQQDSEEKQCSALMKQALEPCVCRHEFPNCQVDVYAIVIQNDGSALSAAITAAGLALAHAGVPMYDLVTSVSIGVQGIYKLIDPDFTEEELCSIPILPCEDKDSFDHGLVTLSYLSNHEQVSQFYQFGSLKIETVNECIDNLVKACKGILPCVQQCLVAYVTKSLKRNEEHEADTQ